MMTESALMTRVLVLFLAFAVSLGGLLGGAALLSHFDNTKHGVFASFGETLELEPSGEDTFDLKLSDNDETLQDGVSASWQATDWLPGEYSSGWVEVHNAGDIDAESVLLTVEVETGDLHYIESETGDITVHDIDNWIIITEMTYSGDDLLPFFTSLLGDNLPPLTMGELDEAAGVDLGGLAAGETKRLAMTFQLLPETGNDYQKDWARMTLTFEALAPQPDLGGTPGFWGAWDTPNKPSEGEINGWLASIDADSDWLVADMNGDGIINVVDMEAILDAGVAKGATREERFLRHYLATRLNVEADRLSLLRHRDITAYDPGNYLGIADPTSTTITEIVGAIESKYPTNEQFEIMKDICDALNNVEI